jgi:hypothetical protein
MERGHPVRLSAKREQRLNEDPMRLMSVLRTLAEQNVRVPSASPWPLVNLFTTISRPKNSLSHNAQCRLACRRDRAA